MLAILMTGCLSQVAPLASVPEWYSTQQLQRSGWVIGYGDAAELDTAKAIARSDLSRTLQTHIRSELRLHKLSNNHTTDRRREQQIDEVSQATLTALVVLRSEQQDGRYYVAIGYDSRPLAERLFAEIATDAWRPTSAPTLLHQSQLLQPLFERLDFLPSMQLTVDQQHYRLGHALQSVRLRGEEIAELLPPQQSPYLTLKLIPSQSRYRPEQLFHLDITTRQAGWLSYLQLHQSGAVVQMIGNQRVAKGQALRYPEPTRYQGLITELSPTERSSRVTHLLLLCETTRDLSPFEPINSRPQHPYQSYRLDHLLTLLPGCEVTLLRQVISE